MRIEPAEMLEAMNWLHGFYASPAGLSRPDGLSIDGKPDFEAIAAWLLDVFLSSRLGGLTVDVSRRNVVCAIQQTPEWQNKHPQQQPSTDTTPFANVNTVGREEFLRALHRLDVFYRSWNGLQRPNGISVNGGPDFEAVAAWIFGSYLNDRLETRSPEEAWDRLVASIQNSQEWRNCERPASDATTLVGKHLMGYQGWFGTPNDGQGNGWDHWFQGPGPSFDFWPDLRELFDSELEPTRLRMADGRPARLFSCHHSRTVRRHFEWMADAGIDGVSIGRFVGGTRVANIRTRFDHLLDLVRDAAERTGRVFFVWYDVSNHPVPSFVDDVKRDWIHLSQDVGITRSPSYLHHKGRPFLGMWGAGAGDRVGTPDDWIQCVSFLKNGPAPATVLVGGTRDWRTNPTWRPVFDAADVVSPWTPGAYNNEQEADGYRRSIIEGDLIAIKPTQDYLPVVFPGYSWHNLQGGNAPLNSTPRFGGRFYWRQLFNAVDAGVTNLFTAMFDEVDEGTASFKIAETQREVPIDARFLSMDSDGERLPSDWYLRLGGAAGKMLRKEIPLTQAMPTKP